MRLTEDLAYAGGKSYGSIDHDIILDLELTASGKAFLVGQAGTGLDLGTGALKGSDTHLNALLGVVTP